MPRKTSKKQGEEKEGSQEISGGPMVTIIKTALAAKLSPRGEGKITYQVGRCGETLLLRISGNESSGRFSKEWVSVEKIRDALSKAPKGATSFKAALLLQEAWQGKSSCNGGFAAAILMAEELLVRDDDPKKKGMQKRSSPDAIETWEKRLLAEELPEDAEVVPLHPPKPKPFFKKAAETEEENNEEDSNP